MNSRKQKEEEVIEALRPYLIKDDEFKSLLEMNEDPSLKMALQTMCKECLPTLGAFLPVSDKDTFGEKRDYLRQIIARKLFSVATDAATKTQWNIPKPAMLIFACKLGLIEALEYQAYLYLNQMEKYVEAYDVGNIHSEGNKKTNQHISEIQKKLHEITMELLPLHWKAGYIYAAIYQQLEAFALLTKLQKLKAVDATAETVDAITEDIEQTSLQIQEIRKNALKNLMCVNLLKQGDIFTALPNTDNLTNSVLLNKFLENETLVKYASASTDPITLLANELRFGMGTDAHSAIESAKMEVNQILLKHGILPSKAPLKEKIDKHKQAQEKARNILIRPPSTSRLGFLKDKK